MNNPFDKKLKEALQQSPELPFSIELKKRILEKARQHEQRKKRWMYGTGVGFIAATAAFLLALLNQPSVPQTDFKSAVLPKLASQPRQLASMRSPFVSVQSAPLQVKQMQVDTDTIRAEVTNRGSIPLSNSQVQGILYLTSPGQEPLYYFVDAPNTELAPNATTKWEFRPVGVPASIHLSDRKPHLMFVYRDFQNPQSAPLQSKLLSIRATGDQKQYVSLTWKLTNMGSSALDINQWMGMIFFKKSPVTADFDSSTYKYFVDLHAFGKESSIIEPRHTLTVLANLIAPPGIDLTKRMSVVLWPTDKTSLLNQLNK